MKIISVDIKTDDECVDHYLNFEHNQNVRKLKFRGLDFSPSSMDHLVFIDDLFVGDVESILDSVNCGSECNDEDVTLSKTILQILIKDGFKIEKEEKINVQCGYSLPHTI
jgi:hypothetical protein